MSRPTFLDRCSPAHSCSHQPRYNSSFNSCSDVIVCAGFLESTRTRATSPSNRSISCTLQPYRSTHECLCHPNKNHLPHCAEGCHGTARLRHRAPITNKSFTLVQLCAHMRTQSWRWLITFWHLEGWFCALFPVDATAQHAQRCRPCLLSGSIAPVMKNCLPELVENKLVVGRVQNPRRQRDRLLIQVHCLVPVVWRVVQRVAGYCHVVVTTSLLPQWVPVLVKISIYRNRD